MSDVGSDRYRNTQGFLTKNVIEIFWELNFLSEVTGCRKTQVSERTGSTVIIIIIIIRRRNGAKTISLQTLFGRLKYHNRYKQTGVGPFY